MGPVAQALADAGEDLYLATLPITFPQPQTSSAGAALLSLRAGASTAHPALLGALSRLAGLKSEG
jgi:uncharacterized protein YraI